MNAYLKSVIYAGAGIGVLVVLLPELITRITDVGSGLDPVKLRWVGAVVCAWGALVYFGCVADFAARGGTPAFWDPPPRLVLNPWFRLARNPMYAGVGLMVVGRGLWLDAPPVVVYAALVTLGFHLFVVFYEEPHLRRVFGKSYRAYCECVPRWVPRLSVRRLTWGALWQGLR